jgi:hypothetical protein
LRYLATINYKIELAEALLGKPAVAHFRMLWQKTGWAPIS